MKLNDDVQKDSISLEEIACSDIIVYPKMTSLTSEEGKVTNKSGKREGPTPEVCEQSNKRPKGETNTNPQPSTSEVISANFGKKKSNQKQSASGLPMLISEK